MRKRYNEDVAIKMYILSKTEKLTHEQIGAKLGFSSASVGRWLRKVNDSPALQKKAQKIVGIPGLDLSSKKKTKRRTPIKYTERLAVKVYVLRQSGLTFPQITREMGGLTGPAAQRWIGVVENTPRLKKEATKLLSDNGTTPLGPATKPKRSNGVEELEKALSENSYLKWCNMGYKAGFVERLLKE